MHVSVRMRLHTCVHHTHACVTCIALSEYTCSPVVSRLPQGPTHSACAGSVHVEAQDQAHCEESADDISRGPWCERSEQLPPAHPHEYGVPCPPAAPIDTLSPRGGCDPLEAAALPLWHDDASGHCAAAFDVNDLHGGAGWQDDEALQSGHEDAYWQVPAAQRSQRPSCTHLSRTNVELHTYSVSCAQDGLGPRRSGVWTRSKRMSARLAWGKRRPRCRRRPRCGIRRHAHPAQPAQYVVACSE